MLPSHSRFIDLRGLRYHVRCWGAAEAPPLVLLHGWMDVSASFQFMVDAWPGMPQAWQVLAPDWRGYGQTAASGADCYWFPDYLADLDFLLDALSPDAPVVLAGHSMGGNVAMLYAGVRPERVRAVINLEGFGLRDTVPTDAPARYARWIDELKAGATLRDYDSLAAVADRLRRNNPRLTEARALFLAAHWSQPAADGRYRLAADPAHRIVNPVLYRWAEAAACLQRITRPVLWVQARQTDAIKWAGDAAELERRRALLADVETVFIDDCGHMVQHDQPERLARLVADFLARRLAAGAP
jgi:pimeloyl-ACP methyl ester carboxylesterase